MVYNRDNINNIQNSEIQFIINDQLFLEALFLEIRAKTISYSSYKKKQSDAHEKRLLQEISYLESNYVNNADEIINKKDELEHIRKEKLKGGMIRSRAKWIQDGEKPTKYFCHLESRIFSLKLSRN